MKKTIQYTLIGLVLLSISSCRQEVPASFDEYVFGVQMVDDKTKIEEYMDYHKNVWPEVEAGFKKAGYQKIRLFRFENYLCMIIQVPEGVRLEEMAKTKELHTQKVKEWNTLMNKYQRGLPGTKEGTTWVAMEKIYEFSNKK